MVDIDNIWENGFSDDFLGKKLTGDRRAFLFMKDTNPVDPDFSYSNKGVVSPDDYNAELGNDYFLPITGFTNNFTIKKAPDGVFSAIQLDSDVYLVLATEGEANSPGLPVWGLNEDGELGELGVTKGKKNSLGLSTLAENIGLDFGFKSSELIQNIKDFINDLIQQIKDLISNYLDFLMKNWEIVMVIVILLLLIVGFAVLKVYTL
mgnify:CR=1 FL=1